MSLRERYPRAQLPTSHYFISVARGEEMRTFSTRPWTLWAGAGVIATLLTWAVGATAYIAFRDDMLGALLTRQAEMQAAYEDRLADARSALDKVASRQLLDQNSFEGKLHELLSRQALLEQRGSLVAQIAKQAAERGGASAPDIAARASAKGGALAALNSLTPPAGAGAARAYAPMDSSSDDVAPTKGKPRPLDEPQKHSALEPSDVPGAQGGDRLGMLDDPDLAPGARLSLLASSLDRTEKQQVSSLETLGATAHRFNDSWKAIIARSGLPIPETTASVPKGVGGPFIPLSGEAAAPFDRAAVKAERDIEAMERLKKTIPFLPIREPLFGDMRETSPFGTRTDPFLGRLALHPGVDLVLAYGAEIHATAAGKIVTAGWGGGYGNMVEIDHGGGVSTVYGHMSEIEVSEGEEVKPGQVIGKVGSTGRSTGPHLHYELRINDEPVDPQRILEVAALLSP
jgi:murein DD-endopeptidase MepM/ murein hydrolase activator NlpD